jgi:hypothetical protein
VSTQPRTLEERVAALEREMSGLKSQPADLKVDLADERPGKGLLRFRGPGLDRAMTILAKLLIAWGAIIFGITAVALVLALSEMIYRKDDMSGPILAGVYLSAAVALPLGLWLHRQRPVREARITTSAS